MATATSKWMENKHEFEQCFLALAEVDAQGQPVLSREGLIKGEASSLFSLNAAIPHTKGAVELYPTNPRLWLLQGGDFHTFQKVALCPPGVNR